MKEKLENSRADNTELHEEIFKIYEWYDEYSSRLQEFKTFSEKTQGSLYSIKLVFEDDIQAWVDRLMSPGFSHKPGMTMLYEPASPRDAFETVLHIRLKAIRKVVVDHEDISLGRENHSTPQQGLVSSYFHQGSVS